MKKIIYTFFLLLISNICISQQSDSITLVKYDSDFVLSDGIYINFQQFKNNSPIPKNQIVTSVSYDNFNFFDKILSEEYIDFFDNDGNNKKIKSNTIWGFCQNGTVYLNWKGSFTRIGYLGSISHFVANITVYDYNPYDYYSSTYYYRTNTRTELRQYLLDMKTGSILDFTYKNVEALLSYDPELQAEYAALSKKKKKQLKFVYIRKFNKRNPLYFPLNNT